MEKCENDMEAMNYYEDSLTEDFSDIGNSFSEHRFQ